MRVCIRHFASLQGNSTGSNKSSSQFGCWLVRCALLWWSGVSIWNQAGHQQNRIFWSSFQLQRKFVTRGASYNRNLMFQEVAGFIKMAELHTRFVFRKPNTSSHWCCKIYEYLVGVSVDFGKLMLPDAHVRKVRVRRSGGQVARTKNVLCLGLRSGKWEKINPFHPKIARPQKMNDKPLGTSRKCAVFCSHLQQPDHSVIPSSYDLSKSWLRWVGIERKADDPMNRVFPPPRHRSTMSTDFQNLESIRLLKVWGVEFKKTIEKKFFGEKKARKKLQKLYFEKFL